MINLLASDRALNLRELAALSPPRRPSGGHSLFADISLLLVLRAIDVQFAFHGGSVRVRFVCEPQTGCPHGIEELPCGHGSLTSTDGSRVLERAVCVPVMMMMMFIGTETSVTQSLTIESIRRCLMRPSFVRKRTGTSWIAFSDPSDLKISRTSGVSSGQKFMIGLPMYSYGVYLSKFISTFPVPLSQCIAMGALLL